MPSLHNINHRDKIIRALQRAGFSIDSGGKHAIVHRDDGSFVSVVPHGKRIKPGTLRAVIKQCELTEEEFGHLYAGKKR